MYIVNYIYFPFCYLICVMCTYDQSPFSLGFLKSLASIVSITFFAYDWSLLVMKLDKLRLVVADI